MAATALFGLMGATSAFAQAAAPAAEETTGLEEIVVTATRQADTANRVPLSIAAVTQQTLDQQGIKQASDLVRTVPGLNVGTPGNGRGTFSIRGIQASVGAATTGVYLDDTSVTKRGNNGINQNNGAPLPVLYDLERVEVLKGPQGTLYGGSSQGGTVRFITPRPSLTTYSGNARLEGNTVKGGDQGYDAGAAIGGPIVQDKLGFRISALKRHNPGWIDAYNPYDNKLLLKDGNGGDEFAVRASVLWQITDRLRVTVSGYHSDGQTDGGPIAATKATPKGQTFTTPQTCNVRVTNTVNPAAPATPTAPASSPALCSQPGVFVRPSVTYGPYDYLGRDDALVLNNPGKVGQYGTTNYQDVYSVDFGYEFDKMSVRSITSYVHDVAAGMTGGIELDAGQRQVLVGGPPSANTGFGLFPVVGPDGKVGDYGTDFISRNGRYGIQQELRFSSPGEQRPFSWVGGLYYSNMRTHIHYRSQVLDGDTILQNFYGISSLQRYGLANTNGTQSILNANLVDNELAAYGEANYWVTDKLRLTAGIRLSRVSFDFDQVQTGQSRGRLLPTDIGASTSGSTTNSPVTPKFGLQYQLTDDNMLYATAAKGFRAGGVNPRISACEAGLQAAGFAADDVPNSYSPDTVWSYEAGGKFRLMDRKMQLNVAAYRIDWTNVQATVALSCGFNFVMNGASARSQGFDLQMQVRPIQPLTFTLNAGYTDAKYLSNVAGPVAGAPISIAKGDGFGIPAWQVSFSAQYDTELFNHRSYLRADYQWQSDYTQGTSYGTASYNPFTRRVDSRDLINVRAGTYFGDLELNLFANNLLNSRDRIGNAGNGRSACSTAAATRNADCTVFATYTPFVSQQYQMPRQIGVQANYRF